MTAAEQGAAPDDQSLDRAGGVVTTPAEALTSERLAELRADLRAGRRTFLGAGDSFALLAALTAARADADEAWETSAALAETCATGEHAAKVIRLTASKVRAALATPTPKAVEDAEIHDAPVIIAAREAAAEQRGREMALREAADDQSWWLTEAMDGDFLLVDCGHIGHNDGRVGISDVRPTDLTRWVAEHLRERAAREAS
jgi:hypothetical protein